MKKYFLSLVILLLFIANSSFANNMLIQNVTTTGNNPTNKTIQVQFDMSWDNSWRDSINWDAAWLFIKFKDANGLWQHAQLSLSGYANGNGTANIVKVTSDKVGAWVYRSALGSGTFNSTSMQLQWNYGLNGLNDASGLEVRVFAVEMVYVPEGEFNCSGRTNIWRGGSPGASFWICYGSGWANGIFTAPGNTFPVINTKLSPVLTYGNLGNGNIITLRIRGDLGIDTNSDGVIDNSTFPIGYHAFYCFKYELTEEQYVDFLNTLTPLQISNIGMAGNWISIQNSKYYSSNPINACGNANETNLFAYADWAGIRPMSILEFNKASYGASQPIYDPNGPGYPASGLGLGYMPSRGEPFLTKVGSFANNTSNRVNSGSSYYGIFDFTGNAREPVIPLNNFNFSNQDGDGKLESNGVNNISSWGGVIFIDQVLTFYGYSIGYGFGANEVRGFRYVRSAE